MSRLNLSIRFTLILGGVFLVGIAIGGAAYWRALQARAQDEITAQGTLLIETMNAVRGYTTKNVRPLLADQLAASPEFISETVPAFSARSVFENLRSQVNFSTYLYKEAALNPTKVDYLYYVLVDRNNGRHAFANNYSEFLRLKKLRP